MSLLQHPIIKAATFRERSQPTISLTTGWLLGEITQFSNEEYTPSSGWGHYPMTIERRHSTTDGVQPSRPPPPGKSRGR